MLRMLRIIVGRISVLRRNPQSSSSLSRRAKKSSTSAFAAASALPLASARAGVSSPLIRHS